MSATTAAPALACASPGCGNTTLDPSGRCHHHVAGAGGAGGAAVVAGPPPKAAQDSSSRTVLTPEEEQFFRGMRTRASESSYGSPYIAHALFALTPVRTSGLGTMAVDDKYRVYIDFKWAMEKGIGYATGVLIHEAWHALRTHGARGKDMIGNDRSLKRKSNIALDAEINDDIVGIVPEDGVQPGKLKDAKGQPLPAGKLAEWYFSHMDDEETKKANQPQDGDPQEGQGDGQGQGQGQGQGGGDQQGSGGGDGEDDAENANDGSGTCGGGSGVTGQEEDYELSEGEAASKTETEQKIIANQVAREIQDAVNNAKDPGTVASEGVREWSKQVLAAKPVDWRSLLRANVRSAVSNARGNQDYTYRRRSRRQGLVRSGDALRPGLVAPEIKIDVAIDTSGSMSGEDLALAVAEVVNVATQSGVRGKGLRAFSVDSQVGSKPVQVRRAEDVKLVGGGGTDMGVAVAQMSMPSRNKPDIGIILTDGFTPWPDKAPDGLKVVIGVIGSQGGTKLGNYRPPSWADVVYIDNDL